MVSHDTVLDFYKNSYEDYKAGLEAVYNNTKKIIFSIGGVKITGFGIKNTNKTKNPNLKNNFLWTIVFDNKLFKHENSETKGITRKVRMNQNPNFDTLTAICLSIFCGILKGNPNIYPTQPLPEFEYLTEVIFFFFFQIFNF